MTPTSPIYAKLVYVALVFFGGAFISEMIVMLKENKWNVVKTLIDFLKDF